MNFTDFTVDWTITREMNAGELLALKTYRHSQQSFFYLQNHSDRVRL